VRAIIVNCTLKPSPEESSTERLAEVVAERLSELGVEVASMRLVDFDVRPGVATDLGDGDVWKHVHDDLLRSEILVVATPTWVGHPSSVAQRMLERMDAMISEQDEQGRPVAYGRVAGVVVTGNEDGAHHVISEIAGGLGDIGYTIPGNAWTYWNRGPGPGPSYLDTEDGHDWSRATGRTMAANLVTVAEALEKAVFAKPDE
jgi:multimeric flavodoxin WrbA